MRLKQICNHPSQWLGDNGWAEEDSGKLGRLREIAEEIAARQDKVAGVHPVQGNDGRRSRGSSRRCSAATVWCCMAGPRSASAATWSQRFQEDEDVPFFVLSVKAGGAGLNLTAASHVIHFDRWWNPAVENQATDRAFRIGQTKNVLVHKFVCRGTVEEKIDQMIESKQQLAGDFLGGGMEADLTEMNDDELLKLVRLDLASALKEG